MIADLAFHPRPLESSPDTAPTAPMGEAGLMAIGCMAEGSITGACLAGDGPVPCSTDFDPSEARRFHGVPAADLAEHALDIEASQTGKPLRAGSISRLGARLCGPLDAVFHTALCAYITVKHALRLIMRPLQHHRRRSPSYGRARTNLAPKIWVTPPPTQAEWAARDQAAGFDVRGTSPTWILRRAYRQRARRRRELEPPLQRAARLGEQAHAADTRPAGFIGPPAPVHYTEVDDLYQVWPPVALPQGPEGLLPLTRDTVAEADGISDAETATGLNELISGYNFALEQFGHRGAAQYLDTLPDNAAAHLREIINYHDANRTASTPNNKAPP